MEKEQIKIGRPKMYTSNEELSAAIERYFNSITITIPQTYLKAIGYEDEEKTKAITQPFPVLNNNGEQVMKMDFFENPTIIGLSHYLGMTRETLNQYSKDEMFSDTIKQAKEKIEKFLENELLRNSGQVTGVIFNLKNNFGWKDKTEIDQTSFVINNTAEGNESAKEVVNKVIERLRQGK